MDDKEKQWVKRALIDSLPVLMAYVPLGVVWGLLWEQSGLSAWWGILFSATIYAGTVQFLALSFINAGAPLPGLLMTVIPVALRNSFYTVALIDKLPEKWAKKALMAFGLVDASFAILAHKDKEQAQDPWYSIPLVIFIQSYWVLGTVLGILVGGYIPDGMESLDFALPALLTTLVLGQQQRLRSWVQVGLAASVAVSLWLILGDAWLLPSVVLCAFISLRAWS